MTRVDVERHAANQRAAAVEPLAGMDALTTKSKQTIPHFYVSVDVDMAAAELWWENWNAAHPNLTASVNDVLVRAAAEALMDVPRLNVACREGKAEPRATADILLVVAVESGLTLVPFAGPHQLKWEDYLRAMKRTIEKARQGRVMGNSPAVAPALAISNLGMFGVKEFAAIIPPMCAAILAIGAVRSQPVVINEQVGIMKACSLNALRGPPRCDGIVAARFLESGCRRYFGTAMSGTHPYPTSQTSKTNKRMGMCRDLRKRRSTLLFLQGTVPGANPITRRAREACAVGVGFA